MRYHKGNDGWGRDSYAIPQFAVAGASDTGTLSDSPCRTDDCLAELEMLRGALKHNGIPSRRSITQSGNAFMVKRWVVVKGTDFDRANIITAEWLKRNESVTRLIHDAT